VRIDAPTFAGGEIGEALVARMDTAKYGTALRRARNVLSMVTGGVYARPGFRFVGRARDSSKRVRALPFQFSISQSYVLEFGHQSLRFIVDGGYVTERQQTIAGITKAAQAVVEVPCHAYAVGDDIYFSGVTGMTQINGRIGRVLEVVDADRVKVDINTTTFSTFTGDVGGVNACDVAPPPPPDPEDPPPPPPYEDNDPDTGEVITGGPLIPGGNDDGQVN